MLGLQKINSFCPQHTIDLSFLAANFNDFALVLYVTVFCQVGLKSQQSRWADHPPATPHYKSVNGYKKHGTSPFLLPRQRHAKFEPKASSSWCMVEKGPVSILHLLTFVYLTYGFAARGDEFGKTQG